MNSIDSTKGKIILASASPRRKELLEQLGLEFEIIPSDINESLDWYATPEEYACWTAAQKADAVARLHNQALVIGADTIVVKDRILGKPQTVDEAINMLLTLQGGSHDVITGLALVDISQDYRRVCYEKTQVEMAPLSLELIKKYVQTGESMDKAGSYGIQGCAAAFIPKIYGCYFNVVGLPLYRLSSLICEYKQHLTGDIYG